MSNLNCTCGDMLYDDTCSACRNEALIASLQRQLAVAKTFITRVAESGSSTRRACEVLSEIDKIETESKLS